MSNQRERAEAEGFRSRQGGVLPTEPDAVESTGVRTALLQSYAGAVREIRSGRFSVRVPAARDETLRHLGEEIGALAENLESRFERVARLSQISVDVSSGLMLEDILERVYESFRGVIPYDRIGCALIDHATWTLRARWARTEASEPFIARGYEQGLSGSSLEDIIRTRHPRIIGDLCEHQRRHPHSDSTRRIVLEGMRSSLTCPLVARGRPIGFLFFSSRRDHAYDQEHVRTYQEIAEQLSVVVEKSLLYERLQQLHAQLEESHAELEHLSSHDATTGLPNRSVIQSALARAMSGPMRNGSRVGLLMIDVDFFKQINDRHGHLAGDAVLREVGQTLARTARAKETIGRYGGDEFAAVVEAGNHGELIAIAERLRRAVCESAFRFEGITMTVTLSIGGALAVPGDASATTRVMAEADRALYVAKAAGRNRAVIANGVTSR